MAGAGLDDARGLELTAAQRERMDATSDLDVLGAWFVRALTATSAMDILGDAP